MAIKMQGTWLVRVKAKNAAFPHTFEIAGAASGNGVYPGTHPGEVTVTGGSWTITIRHNPGSGFISSQLRLKQPTQSGGFYQFDLQSNDTGGDQDFDDLILSCRTPVSANDYLLYGSVHDYHGRCIFNPCFPYWVIDTPLKLREALQVPVLRDWLKEIHPERMLEVQAPFPVDPLGPISLSPHPFPPKDFLPIVVPAPGELATPLKTRFLVRSKEQTLEAATGAKAAKSTVEPIRFQAVTRVEALNNFNVSLDPAVLKRRVVLERALAKYFLCDSDALANVRVRFWEYDRTAAEKSGGAYTGTGPRTLLGSTFTDDFGNYVFRFTTTSFDVADEIVNDLAPGENAFVQLSPDIIAQVMQPLDPSIPAFETAPYWNVPNLKRINICVPRENIGIRPLACEGQHIIQGVGNIVLGTPNPDGTRTGFSNVLDSQGIITARNGLGPTTDCAAWYGTLLLRGCLKNQQVKFYTLEHRRPGGGWQPLDVQFKLPIFIGPFQTNLPVNQGIIGGIPIYLNVETDSGDWLMSYRNIKAQIPTSIFPENGPREIRITGLDSARNPIGGIQEIVTLYILNNGIDLAINPTISMSGAGSVSECGLFTLPRNEGGVVENPEIRVRFKAMQVGAPPVSAGFMGGYELLVQKGSTCCFAVTPGTLGSNAPYPAIPVNRGRSYVPAAGTGLTCDLGFYGTNSEPSETAGFIEVSISPASGGWLDLGQQFCTFGFFLNGHLRRTNGESANWNSSAVPVLFGIQRS